MGDQPAHHRKTSSGFFEAAWSMGSAALTSVSSAVGSALGMEDLSVVDPTSGGETKAGANISDDERQQAFAGYKEYLGKDITNLVALPLWITQPFTILQNMGEIMEYTDALDKAAVTEDPYERMAWVVGFTMGPFAAVERPWKPINPILGETFEYQKKDKGVKFISEQVVHQPPVAVSHAENDLWTFDQVSAPTTKFLGNSVDVYPIGRTRIHLRAFDETFSLVPPATKVYNVIIGSIWIDTSGDYTLVNTETGDKVHMYYTPCGWFGSGRYEVSGTIKKADGTPVMALSGMWNSHLDAVKCDAEGNPLPDAKPIRVWECKDKPKEDPYNFTYFAHELNSCKDVNPLPTDSRRRPDRYMLETGKSSSEAGKAQHALEAKQRAERKEREKKGVEFKPKWFRPVPKEQQKVVAGEYSAEECPFWEFNGEFLKQEPRPSCSETEVQGAGFNPWEFPELHKE